jgi:hypothetical protein
VSVLDLFRIEVVTLDLARTISAERGFKVPLGEMISSRPLLLALISSRVRWDVACEIVRGLLPIVHAGSSGLHLREAVLTAVARHRHPHQVARWLEALLDNNGRALRRALGVLKEATAPALARRRLYAASCGAGGSDWASRRAIPLVPGSVASISSERRGIRLSCNRARDYFGGPAHAHGKGATRSSSRVSGELLGP